MPAKIKDNVIEMIRRMPDDATVTDIMAELYIRQKIDVGLQQLTKANRCRKKKLSKGSADG